MIYVSLFRRVYIYIYICITYHEMCGSLNINVTASDPLRFDLASIHGERLKSVAKTLLKKAWVKTKKEYPPVIKHGTGKWTMYQ